MNCICNYCCYNLSTSLYDVIRKKIFMQIKGNLTNNDRHALQIISKHFGIGSPIRQDYPLNLSILIRGGKENNNETLSNCE
jgi:hypothetical protein